MTKVVWKTVLLARDEQEISVSPDAEFLFVHEQNGDICLWYRCTPDLVKVPRKIGIKGTGHSGAHGIYIGSAILHGGALVFHVFDQSPCA